MSEEDGKLIDAIAKSDELDIFQTDLVVDLIDWRWTRFAKRVHLRGFYFHVAYIIGLFIFVGQTYLDYEFYGMPKIVSYLILGILLLYPLMYDGTQLYSQGRDYFRSFWNYIDIFHIIGGFVNVFL